MAKKATTAQPSECLTPDVYKTKQKGSFENMDPKTKGQFPTSEVFADTNVCIISREGENVVVKSEKTIKGYYRIVKMKLSNLRKKGESSGKPPKPFKRTPPTPHQPTLLTAPTEPVPHDADDRPLIDGVLYTTVRKCSVYMRGGDGQVKILTLPTRTQLRYLKGDKETVAKPPNNMWVLVENESGERRKIQSNCLKKVSENDGSNNALASTIPVATVPSPPRDSRPPPTATPNPRNPPHNVNHFQYRDWPDHSVPKSDKIVDFCIKVNDLYERCFKPSAPDFGTIIHCSAGVGRTGTIYVLLSIVNIIRNILGKPDDIITNEIIDDIILRARQNRNTYMVQTFEQYKFIFQCLDEMYKKRLLNMRGQWKLELKIPSKSDFTALSRIADVDDYMPPHPQKNRYTNIKSRSTTNVKLVAPERYINANFMDPINGCIVIATQCPLPTTKADFWDMVQQYNIGNIIMVADFKKNKCEDYLPTEGNPYIIPKEQGDTPLKVEYIEHSIETSILVTTLKISPIQGEPTRQYHKSELQNGANTPSIYATFITPKFLNKLKSKTKVSDALLSGTITRMYGNVDEYYPEEEPPLPVATHKVKKHDLAYNMDVDYEDSHNIRDYGTIGTHMLEISPNTQVIIIEHINDEFVVIRTIDPPKRVVLMRLSNLESISINNNSGATSSTGGHRRTRTRRNSKQRRRKSSRKSNRRPRIKRKHKITKKTRRTRKAKRTRRKF